MAGLNIGALDAATSLADTDMLELERPDGDPEANPAVPNTPLRTTLGAIKAHVAGEAGDSYEPGDVLITARDPGAGWLEQGQLYLQSAYPGVFALVGLIGDGAPGATWQTMTPTTALPGAPSAMVHVRDRILLATVSNEIYRSTDGGMTWGLVSSPAGSKLQMQHIGNDVVLAGGLSGFLVRSDDAGLTWTQITSGTTQTITGFVRFNDARVLMTVQANNQSRLSTDAGLTWSTVTGLSSSVTGGVALSSSVGIVTPNGTGTSIYRTTNGGLNWAAVTVPNGNYIRTALHFGNGAAVLFGTGTAIRSTDSGLTWTEVTLPTMGAIQTGIVTGDSEAVLTSNGAWAFTGDKGATWGLTSGSPTWTTHAIANIPGEAVVAAGTSGAQSIALPDYSYNTATHFRAPRIALATEWLKGFIKA